MKNQIKLCVISSDYPSPGRPMYVFVEQLVKEMVSQGVEINVIAPQSITHNLLRHEPLLPKIETRQVGSKSYKVWRPYYISLGNCPEFIHNILERIRLNGIKRVIKATGTRPDALYGHFWQNALVIKDYANAHNIPVFVACGEGDNALEDMVASISATDKANLVKAVKGVISVSSENKRKCIEYGLAEGKDIVVLPNSVDSGLFDKPTYSNKREELGVSNEDMLIAYTGAFIHRKGSGRLAAAVEKLNNPHIKLMFIGKNRPGDDATPECQGIVFKGGLDHDDIPDYLKSADIFCLPTLNEGCSNAIVEAVACGLPVVSSDLPFNHDVLDSTNAILIDPMNVDQIAYAIKELYSNKELRKKLSEGAFEKAKDLKINNRAYKIIEFIKEKIAVR